MDTQKSNEGSSLGKDGGRTASPGSSAMGTAGSSQLGGSGSGGSTSTGTSQGSQTGSHIGQQSGSMQESQGSLSQGAQQAVDKLASGAHQSVDKAAGALSNMSQGLDEKARQLGDAYGRFVDSSRDYVRQRPMTALAVAAGTGWLLSRILSSRRQ